MFRFFSLFSLWPTLRRDASTESTSTSSASAGHRARSIARTFGWLLLADFVFCIGFAVWTRTLAYQSDLAQGAVASRNLADATIHRTESKLDAASWMLEAIVDHLEADGLDGMTAATIRRLLTAQARDRHVAFSDVLVIDRSGRVVASIENIKPPGADETQRGYFIHHAGHADRGVHVGPPISGASDTDAVLPLSRRIDDADGRFAGLVVAAISVRDFQDEYKRLELGPHDTVTLAMTDRTPVAQVSTGSPASVDSVHGIRQSARYPLIVDAALGKDDILANWERITWEESAALAGEMLAAYIICFWVIAQMRVRERLERTLRNTQDVLEQQNAALARLAHTDGLTGLYNRRHLDERMAFEVARGARERTPLSLIMIDVDFFKRYNDTYGHAAGDDCLRMVARILGATVNRPADLAARFGGEEFAVLLPNTTGDGARSIAEAICDGVRAAGVAHGASDFGHVTISAGVATVVPNPGDNVRALVESADAALYRAKETGRNRVSL